MKTSKRIAAALRKQESELLQKLCSEHGYQLSDSLPKSQRSAISATKTGGKLELTSSVVVKLCVPANGSLGLMITAQRNPKAKSKAKNPTKAAP